MPPTENWERTLRTTYRRQLIAAKAIIDGYARLRRTVKYLTLEKMIDLAHPREPAVRNALLDLISSDANDAGRGLITVIAEREQDDMPGPGWFALAEQVGKDVSDPAALVRSERDYVYAHANDDVESSIF